MPVWSRDGIQDYAQYDGGQARFEGHGVVSCDPEAGQYVMHWFDSMGTPANVFQGSFEGDALVLTSTGPQWQMRGTLRATASAAHYLS